MAAQRLQNRPYRHWGQWSCYLSVQDIPKACKLSICCLNSSEDCSFRICSYYQEGPRHVIVSHFRGLEVIHLFMLLVDFICRYIDSFLLYIMIVFINGIIVYVMIVCINLFLSKFYLFFIIVFYCFLCLCFIASHVCVLLLMQIMYIV